MDFYCIISAFIRRIFWRSLSSETEYMLYPCRGQDSYDCRCEMYTLSWCNKRRRTTNSRTYKSTMTIYLNYCSFELSVSSFHTNFGLCILVLHVTELCSVSAVYILSLKQFVVLLVYGKILILMCLLWVLSMLMSLFIMLMMCNTFDYSPLNSYLVIFWMLDFKIYIIIILLLFVGSTFRISYRTIKLLCSLWIPLQLIIVHVHVKYRKVLGIGYFVDTDTLKMTRYFEYSVSVSSHLY